MTRSSQTFDDDLTVRQYADAHRAAADAARLVRGRVERDTWVRVIDAMGRANGELAWCDDAWLELRTAYLEMMAANAGRRRLRREEWGKSICTACRYRGPGSDTVTRMREAAKAASRSLSKAEARRLVKASRRMDDECGRSGLTSAAAIEATWRLAEVLGHLQMGDRLAETLATMVGALRGDDRQPSIAWLASFLCADVGQVETGRDLYELHYKAEVERLAGRDAFSDRLDIATVQQVMADYHLMNGEAARAETLVRTALASLPDPGDGAGPSSRGEAERWGSVHDACLSLLPDCLLAQGRRQAANAAYRAAHRHFAGIVRPTAEEAFTAKRLGNCVVYTGRRWQAHI